MNSTYEPCTGHCFGCWRMGFYRSSGFQPSGIFFDIPWGPWIWDPWDPWNRWNRWEQADRWLMEPWWGIESLSLSWILCSDEGGEIDSISPVTAVCLIYVDISKTPDQVIHSERSALPCGVLSGKKRAKSPRPLSKSPQLFHFKVLKRTQLVYPCHSTFLRAIPCTFSSAQYVVSTPPFDTTTTTTIIIWLEQRITMSLLPPLKLFIPNPATAFTAIQAHVRQHGYAVFSVW